MCRRFESCQGYLALESDAREHRPESQVLQSYVSLVLAHPQQDFYCQLVQPFVGQSPRTQSRTIEPGSLQG